MSKQWRAAAAVLVVAGSVAGIAAVVAPRVAPEPVALATVTAAAVPGVGPQGRVPQFVVECGWSHAAPDDPIVHPGHSGRSHLHDFFGNTATDADSTAEQLLAEGSGTTCEHRLDKAAYWAPALRQGGEPVQPTGSIAYYRPGAGIDPTTIAAYPTGLKMVAGDQAATAPQAVEVASWHCGASPVLHTEPPACPATAPLRVRVVFPDCWDGEHLDSDDHQSHVVRSDLGRCPDTHPVSVPQLTFEVEYPVTEDVGDLELASGGVHSVHADFVNAWEPEALAREVRVCLNGAAVCGVASNRATG